MHIEKVRETANTATTRVSELARQLNFVGIAVLWIFLIGDNTGSLVYKGNIVYPLACFISSLVLDLFQYIYQTIRWKRLGDMMDKAGLTEKDVIPTINTPAYLLFWTKIVFVILGYFFIAINLGIEIIS